MRRWLVLVGLVVTGCTPTMYHHPTATLTQESRDEVECKAQAEGGAGPVGPLFRHWIVADLYKKCLVGRGYVKQEGVQ